MYKKHRLQIAVAVCLPTIIFLISLLFFLSPQTLLFFIDLSLGIGLFALLFFIKPYRSWRIGYDKETPIIPVGKWLLMIFSIEIIFMLLFLSQYLVLFNTAISTNGSELSQFNFTNTLSVFLGYNYGLFPWSFITILSVAFAKKSFYSSETFPFSVSITQHFKKHSVIGKIIELMICLSLRIGARCFIAINIVVFAMMMVMLFFSKTTTLFFPISGLFIMLVLYFIFFNKKGLIWIAQLEKKKQIMPWAFLLLTLFITLLFSLSYMGLNTLPSNLSAILKNMKPQSISVTPLDETTLWTIWNWTFWILSFPLISSLMIKVSKGRSVYGFITAVLTLPLLFFILFAFYDKQIAEWFYDQRASIVLLTTLSISGLFLLGLFLKHKSQAYLWFGYLPIHTVEKIHDLGVKQILLIIMLMIGCLTAFKLYFIPLIMLFCALPLTLIFLAMSLL